MAIPTINVSGTPHERGIAHGSSLREQVRNNIQLYYRLLARDTAVLHTDARKLVTQIEKFHPEYKEEMDGIAIGADVDPVEIYMLNARTELFASTEQVLSECSIFFFSETALLCENWDWLSESAPLTAVLIHTYPDDRKMMTFTEAGMLGKIGISSAGFGVAFNYLFPNGPLDGLPVHVLLRAILDAPSYDDAIQYMTCEHLGTSGNILVASTDGRAVDYELSGTAVSTISLTGNMIAHTNHYVGGMKNDPEAGMGFLENSRARLERIEKIAKRQPHQTYTDAECILADRAEGNGMLCRNFLPTDPGATPTGTVASVLMDLQTRTMHVALLPQQGERFQAIVL